jgi:hypothetical protein
MNKLNIFVSLLILIASYSCGGNSKDLSDNTGSDAVELFLKGVVSGSIATQGEVDWYHYRAVEANNMLQVKTTSNTYRPDVDLLVTVYELDENGNKVRLYADHAPEGSLLPADIEMNVYIDTPKDLYFAVRDLLDDEASDNPYYLSIDFASATDENNNFSQASALVMDDNNGCQNDRIDAIGDIDIFRFTAIDNGVYAVNVDFSPFAGGTDVELSIDLYNSDGELIQSLSKQQGHNYLLVPYLTAGLYYVLVDDYGRDDFDTSSPYQICITSVSSQENNENDTINNATDMEYTPSSQTFTITGAIEYAADKDWYNVPLDTIVTNGFKVLHITFDDGDQNTQFNYRIHIEDSGNEALLDHNYTGGSTAYQTQIKSGAGDHYIMIQSADNQIFSENAPYTVSVQVLDVEDPAEMAVKANGIGNDTIETADVLIPSAHPNDITEAKIGYRGDEDWYEVAITNTTAPQVLEVFLDTDSQASLVDYYLSIMRDGVIKKVYDANGGDGGTELKTSILIPAINSPVSYYFKVSDYQGDDGDGTIPYRIRANLNGIPSSLPADSSITGTVIYHDEAAEIADGTAEPIILEYNSINQKTYRANTTLLNFNVLNPPPGIQKSKSGSLTTITFPWIAGYIDFQGDQDWFKIDFGQLIGEVASTWYYEIHVNMHVGSPGSQTEYVWKLYRDRNNNQILVDRPGDSNGFFASAGDVDTIIQPIDITTPSGVDEEFWVGSDWEGSFYLSMSDFNYVGSLHPDDDWGYDGAPYYFKITLIYHPGVSHP